MSEKVSSFCHNVVLYLTIARRDIPSSDSAKFSNWLHRDLVAELTLSLSEDSAPASKGVLDSPISSNSAPSAPTPSSPKISQQLQNLTVTSDVELQSPAEADSLLAHDVSVSHDSANLGAIFALFLSFLL